MGLISLLAAKASIVVLVLSNTAPLNDTQVTDLEADRIIYEASQYLEEAGVNVVIRTVRRIDSPVANELYAYNEQESLMWHLMFYAKDNRLFRDNRIVSFLCPRALEGYSTADAWRVEYNSKAPDKVAGLTRSTAQAYNIEGQERIGHSAAALAQQWLRFFGARLQDNDSIMSRNVWESYERAQPHLEVNKATRRQVRRYLARLNNESR